MRWDRSLNLLDPEHPSPARVGGEEAANDRSTHARESHNQANYRGYHWHQPRRCDFGINDHGHRVQASAPNSLRSSKSDELFEAGRKAASQGCGEKDEEGQAHHRFSPHDIGDPGQGHGKSCEKSNSSAKGNTNTDTDSARDIVCSFCLPTYERV